MLKERKKIRKKVLGKQNLELDICKRWMVGDMVILRRTRKAAVAQIKGRGRGLR